MARIAGVELPPKKRMEVGLTAIYGIGHSLAGKILSGAGVNPSTRVKDLTEEEVNKLRKIIENDYKIEGELRREISSNITRLIKTNCYRGIRHKSGLPVRGQRTRCNARTRKGSKRTMGGRKKGVNRRG